MIPVYSRYLLQPLHFLRDSLIVNSRNGSYKYTIELSLMDPGASISRSLWGAVICFDHVLT
jgi:hypothetical protein